MILRFIRHSRSAWPRLVVLVLIAAAEFGCQKKAAVPPSRYAVVRFENLSGDPSNEWIARAASEILPVSLAGAMDGPVLNTMALGRLAPALGSRPAGAPGISSERAQALLAGATRIFSGYVERAGNMIRIVITEEDAASGKSLRIVSAEDASGLGAITKVAREVSPAARPWLTTSEPAARLYATALETNPDTAKAYLEQATQKDPDFGPAWLVLAQIEMTQGDRSDAASVIEKARQHRLDALTRANLDLQTATLSGASATARIAAERRIAALTPSDVVLLRSLAQAETDAGEFGAAAADWKKVTDELRDDPLAWNSLGYARSYAGDYAGALSAFQMYERLRPAEANPLDSIGDLNYSYRKFGDAASSYLQASAKDPTFEGYGDLYKAGWAKFELGDKAGGDALFEKFRTAREKSGDALAPLFAADWIYRTGHPADGMKSLRRTVESTNQPSLRADGYAQLAVWDLLAGDRGKAAGDSAAAGPVTTGSVLIARFISLPSASPAEWEARASRMLQGAQFAPLRSLALGYALLLDGKRDAALPVWEQIAAQAHATDFHIHAIETRLRGRPLDHPLLPDPGTFNEFAALPDKL